MTLPPAKPPERNVVGACACGEPITRRIVKAWQYSVDHPEAVADYRSPPAGARPECRTCRESDPAYVEWEQGRHDRQVAYGARWTLVADVLGASRAVDRLADRTDEEGEGLFEDALRSLRVRLGLLRAFDARRLDRGDD